MPGYLLKPIPSVHSTRPDIDIQIYGQIFYAEFISILQKNSYWLERETILCDDGK